MRVECRVIVVTLSGGNSLRVQLNVQGQERLSSFRLLPPPRRPPSFFFYCISSECLGTVCVLIGRPPLPCHTLSLNCVVRCSDLRLAGCSHISAIRFATCSPNSPFLSLPVASCRFLSPVLTLSQSPPRCFPSLSIFLLSGSIFSRLKSDR